LHIELLSRAQPNTPFHALMRDAFTEVTRDSRIRREPSWPAPVHGRGTPRGAHCWLGLDTRRSLCLGAGMIVRDIVPRSAIRTIVLPHRPPSPLAEIGPPPLPMGAAVPSLFEPPLLMGD